MKKLQTVLAVASCKLVRSLLRITKRGGGTALPGKAAMKFQKNILAETARGMEIAVVTGTNGKTTTSNMIETALAAAGKDVLANKSGANLLSGVTAEFCCAADWRGRPGKRFAVIECDEGALKQVVPLIRPRVIVVTNLFRDQLDRYGEVMHTLEQIRRGVESVPESTLCLNSGDSLVSSLALDVPNRVVYFGLDMPFGGQEPRAVSDAAHCICCGAPYRYHFYTYAHLGDFYCPSCGYRRRPPEVSVRSVSRMDASGTEFCISVGGQNYPARIPLPAIYNVYNAAAAVAACLALGESAPAAIGALSGVHSSFGRMETFYPGKEPVQMILVKNPAGCTQTIGFLTGLPEDYTLVLCLNDRTADGHDISWIWDAEYERFAADPRLRQVYVSGDRAEDMQLRLKYAGVPEERIVLEKDNVKLLAMMRESQRPVFVMPNYTAMLSLRAVLSEATGAKAFWEK
ncbi:Mur ligase family protein [Lachnoclostridium sp. Marseille-P6806]|uniref:Mur ligase family protein n=1 Tax=Lachnoclostridium sp. Marseille-P6806 TaxID=2364793 RepID=UPI00102F8CB6|nr:Mur ligase family protein [Lachnoclostridium sp. Marseille-P6806]